jgi:hypothetical protein
MCRTLWTLIYRREVLRAVKFFGVQVLLQGSAGKPNIYGLAIVQAMVMWEESAH